jgi:raffinose/stachyose/melibiose transport system substrate-binding protein
VRNLRRNVIGVAALAISLLVTACGSGGSVAGGSSQSGTGGKVNLVLWQNLGNGNQAQMVPVLIKAFEKQHPNITVTNVQQPRANYFSLLQAAAVSGSGPDLVNMWTGLFTLQYKSYLEPLSSWVPAADLANMSGLQWSNVGFAKSSNPYVIPLQQQFYIGFYDKALFKKAGITSVPTDWSELFSDCKLLKAIGTTCIQEGTQNLSGEFYPWYNMSYLMAGAFSSSQWQSLYNGSIKWTSPAVVSQLTKWHTLFSDGYINSDALTATNVQSNFLKGKAAIIIKGNWDTSQFESTLGKNVGVFVPPFSSAPAKKIVEFAGNGLAMTSYSPHKAAAAEFLRFLTSPEAGRIVAQAGLVPDVKGVAPTNVLAQKMVNLVQTGGYSVYPMLDNVVQPGVVTAGSSVLPDMLVGGVTPSSAASSMLQAWQQLALPERGSSWASYKVPA